MTTFKVNTHIVNAIPEYIEPVASNESEAFKKSIRYAYNSYLHAVEEMQNGHKASLKQRTEVYEGFADENMPAISRSNVSGSAKIQNIVPDSKSDAFKKWLDEQASKNSLHCDEEVQNGHKSLLEKKPEISADKNTPVSRSSVSGIAKIAKSKL